MRPRAPRARAAALVEANPPQTGPAPAPPPTTDPAIARKKSPESLEKRRRAIAKQRKREQKLADRTARNAERKAQSQSEQAGESSDAAQDPVGDERQKAEGEPGRDRATGPHSERDGRAPDQAPDAPGGDGDRGRDA